MQGLVVFHRAGHMGWAMCVCVSVVVCVSVCLRVPWSVYACVNACVSACMCLCACVCVPLCMHGSVHATPRSWLVVDAVSYLLLLLLLPPPLAQMGSEGSGAGQLRLPRGLRLKADRHGLVVADSGNDRLCVFTLEGVFMGTVGTPAVTGLKYVRTGHPLGVIPRALARWARCPQCSLSGALQISRRPGCCRLRGAVAVVWSGVPRS